MSVQFGRWEFDGQVADPEFIRRGAALTAKYAIAGGQARTCGPITIFFQPFHAGDESEYEVQPVSDPTGLLLTWDGRLDNRNELRHRLEIPDSGLCTDAEIVLAAYKQWGASSFPVLLGDWALVLWDPAKQALLLARDFMGTRQLFYKLESTRITWSSVLDPLVLLSELPLAISEEFIAGYLSTGPATDLTPYGGINAVPPSTLLQVERARAFKKEYWKFDTYYRIRYRKDCEYEEHFRQLLFEAVRRRLRSSSPVLAELSGGMDSSSIVCVADALFATDQASCPRLDTISYYDDDEPNWNERPFLSLIEKKRGRQGYHVYVGGTDGAFLPPNSDLFFPLPGTDSLSFERTREFACALRQSQSRVTLSGIGGDEFLGGVPTPVPELQDHFVHGRWFNFARQLLEFGLRQRRPWTHLSFDTVEEFLPQFVRRLYDHPPIAPWLTPALVRRNVNAFWADKKRMKLFGPRPSFQAGLSTVDHMRRQLCCSHLNALSNHRATYPLMDRDLLAFLLAIPREQLVRPGQRRSLMRRALAGFVPPEIFARKRKAYITRQPLASIDSSLWAIEGLLKSPFVDLLGWVDKEGLTRALESAERDEIENLIPLLGTIKVELWLRSLAKRTQIDLGQSHAFDLGHDQSQDRPVIAA